MPLLGLPISKGALCCCLLAFTSVGLRVGGDASEHTKTIPHSDPLLEVDLHKAGYVFQPFKREGILYLQDPRPVAYLNTGAVTVTFTTENELPQALKDRRNPELWPFTFHSLFVNVGTGQLLESV